MLRKTKLSYTMPFILFFLGITLAYAALSIPLKVIWDLNTEPDMNHYELWINGEMTIVPHPPVFPIIYNMTEEKEYVAYLIAVDHAGNKSPPSDTTKYTLDLPPVACSGLKLSVTP